MVDIMEATGTNLKRGVEIPSLNREKKYLHLVFLLVLRLRQEISLELLMKQI